MAHAMLPAARPRSPTSKRKATGGDVQIEGLQEVMGILVEIVGMLLRGLCRNCLETPSVVMSPKLPLYLS